MTDRPILFSAPMVRALLNGTKTQTRRILKPQPSDFQGAKLPPAGKSWVNKKRDAPFFAMHHDLEHWCWWDEYHEQGPDWIKVRFAKGDRLWVREHWRTAATLDGSSPSKIEADCIEAGYRKPWAPMQYEADGYCDNWEMGPAGRFRQGMHMCRWGSRLTLEVSDVRVERLQDISEADAAAEGFDRCVAPNGNVTYQIKDLLGGQTAVRSYRMLWDQINGEGAWDENPFVVAVSFTVHRGNIDQMARAS